MAVSSPLSSSIGAAQALACFHTSRVASQRTACSRLPCIRMCALPAGSKKTVWVWTENRQVMTAAVERGWSTFLFASKELSKDWSSTARIHPLFIDGLEILDEGNEKVAAISVISSPSELQLIQPENMEVQNTVIDFRGDWQVIPAENIVLRSRDVRKPYWPFPKTQLRLKFFLRPWSKGLMELYLK